MTDYPSKSPTTADPAETHLTVADFLSGVAVFRVFNDARTNISTVGLPSKSKRGANKLARQVAAATGEIIR